MTSENPNWIEDAVLESPASKPSDKHPGRRATAATDDGPYDFGHFESFAGPNTSESEFVCAVYDLRRDGADVDSIVDRNGRYDRTTGKWINRNGSTVTTLDLIARLAKVSK